MTVLKETRKRISAAKTVRKITKAMKLISASKSKAAQVANAASQPYSQGTYSLVENLWKITNHNLHPLLKRNKSRQRCHVLITTDKGLCGSLLDHMESYLEKEGVFGDPQDHFILIGKKGIDMLSKKARSAEALFEVGFRKPSYPFVIPIVRLITDGYLSQKYGKVIVYYTSFVTVLAKNPDKKQILPALETDTKGPGSDIAIYEPDADAVLENLLSRYLEIQLYQLILESSASEHSERMFAMDKATHSAEAIIDELTLLYNKGRQENITRELLEITATSEVA